MSNIKSVIKKVLPRNIVSLYHSAKKRLKYTPPNERVHFDAKSVSDGHFNVTYRGISMIRCPFDYVLYQMMLFEVKPDLVIEIGTNNGGTTLYLADIMDMIGHGSIHSIDIENKTSPIIENNPRIKLFRNGWEKYDVKEAQNFKKILIIEDASHTYEDSRDALRKFSQLVSIGSYYVVEDGIVNELGRELSFRGGPLKAIREFLAKNNNFIVDRRYCDMFGKNATFNVNGYLKRLK